MNQIEQAILEECAIKCAKEMHKTLKLFTSTDKTLVKTELRRTINEHLQRLEHAN